MKIVSSSHSKSLAQAVKKLLKQEIFVIKLVQFADGELKPTIPLFRTEKVFLIHSTYPHPNKSMVELLLILDALKRNGIKKIVAAIPYLAYTRQDQIFKKGEPLSAALFAKLLETAGVNQIITFDLHSERVIKFFKIPLIHLFAAEQLLVQHPLMKKVDVIISPDFGGLNRAKKLAKAVQKPVAFIKKQRSKITGKIKVVQVHGEIKKKNCLIVDDAVSGGQTIIKGISLLKKEGANKIFVFATHPIFAIKSTRIFDQLPIERFYTTDSIEIPKEKRFKKLEIISLASVLIKCTPDFLLLSY